MTILKFPILLLSLFLLVGALLPGCSSLKNPWSQIKSSFPGPVSSIGNYSAGCLKGGLSLYPSDIGYEVMRPSRRRYYGHPVMIRYVENLGRKVDETLHQFILVGDISQPRGGPTDDGHTSHQTGLDADIWFWKPEENGRKKINLDDRENLGAKSMVTKTAEGERVLDPLLWNQEKVKLLELAALPAETSRIFVHPLIKKYLCEHFPGEAWIRKIRPWWGHDDHFHVRLLCPEGDSLCENQEAIPEGSGCDASLDWWFTPEATTPKTKGPAAERKWPELPSPCQELL